MTLPRPETVPLSPEFATASARRERLRVMSVVNLRPRKFGSFEEYTVTLSRRLRERDGTSVVVFSESPPPHLIGAYHEAGVRLEAKAFRSFGWSSAQALLRLIHQHQPDIVHLHFVDLLSFDVAAAALATGARVVFSEHSSNIITRTSQPKRLALRIAKGVFSAPIDRVVAPSEYVMSRLVGEGVNASKVLTIRNGVNAERFRSPVSGDDVRRKYGLSTSATLVASSALLIPEKGIDVLIEAAKEVIRSTADVQFVHIGDGPCLAAYRERVAALGLTRHFQFVGLLDLPEIAPLIASADVFTLPCVWGEAFSLVVLEAMAAGKPVIATRLGGNVEAVDEGRSGLLIPPRDAPALAEAILTLHRDPVLRSRLAAEGMRRSVQFTVDRWVDDTINLYEQMLRRSEP